MTVFSAIHYGAIYPTSYASEATRPVSAFSRAFKKASPAFRTNTRPIAPLADLITILGIRAIAPALSQDTPGKTAVKPDNCTFEQASTLDGRSISPMAAALTMDVITYDHCGVVVGFKKIPTIKQYQLLKNNIIEPLTERADVNQTGRIRSAGEATVAIAALINKAESRQPALSTLSIQLKNDYLSGKLSKESLQDRWDAINNIIGRSNSDRILVEKIEEIIASIAQQHYIAKANDNFYGRTFDTELALHIIARPTSEMAQAALYIRDFLLDDFNSQTESDRDWICARISDQMHTDPAPWKATVEEAQQFLDAHTPNNFIAMLKTQSPFSISMVVSTAVLYTLHGQAPFSTMMDKANELYDLVITPSRNLTEIGDAAHQRISNHHGVLLRYQKNSRPNGLNAAIPSLGNGERPIDRYRLPQNSDKPGLHDLKAMAAERAMGVGMSGSANVLRELFQTIGTSRPDFPMEHAKMISAAYLTFSGGHSINEAYNAFEYDEAQDFAPISYTTLSSRNAAFKDAIDYAYKQMLTISGKYQTQPILQSIDAMSATAARK